MKLSQETCRAKFKLKSFGGKDIDDTQAHFQHRLKVSFKSLCPKALTRKWVLLFFVRKDTKQ